MAEGEAGFDAIHVGFINHDGLRHMAFLAGTLARQKVTPGSMVANNLAGPGDLETFGH